MGVGQMAAGGLGPRQHLTGARLQRGWLLVEVIVWKKRVIPASEQTACL